jgi:hypothetical protein
VAVEHRHPVALRADGDVRFEDALPAQGAEDLLFDSCSIFSSSPEMNGTTLSWIS